jgi:hypothetical protein
MILRILPFIFILISIGIFFEYLNPAYTGTIVNAQTTIAGEDAGLKAAQDFSKKQDDLTAKKNAMAPTDLARLQTFLPDSIDKIQLLADVSALATRSGLEASGFTVQDNSSADSSVEASGYKSGSTSKLNSLTLSFTAAGSYGSFLTFLTAVEQSLRPMDIKQLTITTSSTGVYTYSITIREYWLR